MSGRELLRGLGFSEFHLPLQNEIGLGTREEKGLGAGFIFVSTVSQFYSISACIKITARYIDHY